MIHPGEEPFLAAIIANPADDLPRTVFADWLDEHGDPDRAEFIRLQCRLAGTLEDETRRPAVEARVRELIAAHGKEWREHDAQINPNGVFEPNDRFLALVTRDEAQAQERIRTPSIDFHRGFLTVLGTSKYLKNRIIQSIIDPIHAHDWKRDIANEYFDFANLRRFSLADAYFFKHPHLPENNEIIGNRNIALRPILLAAENDEQALANLKSYLSMGGTVHDLVTPFFDHGSNDTYTLLHFIAREKPELIGTAEYLVKAGVDLSAQNPNDETVVEFLGHCRDSVSKNLLTAIKRSAVEKNAEAQPMSPEGKFTKKAPRGRPKKGSGFTRGRGGEAVESPADS